MINRKPTRLRDPVPPTGPSTHYPERSPPRPSYLGHAIVDGIVSSRPIRRAPDGGSYTVQGFEWLKDYTGHRDLCAGQHPLLLG